MCGDPDIYARPLHGEIARLRRLLDTSPCMLVVKSSPEVMTLMGHGDRVMALEVQRLRGVIEKIADGTIADKDVPAFAFAALDN